ncbi:MAG: hypothetical protein N5P05_003871 [Chroococcopsis gigantea SAG 12.99]|jgi:hypothetical protein|nr:DUF4335 domain-containing protein [Chlorogloea purpurea SAG 13.99]MDV3002265.1 hypothetical protein [Chroococcopsis gigantea SAG 12.99]
MPNSLIRRYTPPTCTLEIWGKVSPLSVWAGKNLLDNLKFELRLDDPRMLENDQMVIKGDRTGLQFLSEVVGNYVQNLLKTSAEELSLSLAFNDSYSLSHSNNIPSLPSLQPKGLVNHELFLGGLTGDNGRNSINLTTSQLFDLANALEEYEAEIDVIPEITRKQSRKLGLTWTGIAAATVATVAAGAWGVKMYQESNREVAITPPPVAQNKSKDTLPSVPLPPTGAPAPSPTIPTTLDQQTPLPTPGKVEGGNAPSRVNTVPLVVPPRPNLPPPPSLGNVTPNSTAIVITPDTSSKTPIVAGAAPTSQRPGAVATVPPQIMNPTPAAPNLPALPPISNQDKADTSLNGGTNQMNRVNAAAKANPSTNLLDTIPQVAETREYFKARWQPPQSLKQTLEYRLVLNQDGSLKQIIPLGQAARIYLDRTSMPLLNEPFVSPLEIAGNPELRLVLSPDGTVRTFMEEK